jgi:hypothetical protein
MTKILDTRQPAVMRAGQAGPRAVLSALAPLRSEDVGKVVGVGLCRRDYSHQVGKTLSLDAPALRQREGLVAVRLGAEKHSDLIKDAAEVSRARQPIVSKWATWSNMMS